MLSVFILVVFLAFAEYKTKRTTVPALIKTFQSSKDRNIYSPEDIEMKWLKLSNREAAYERNHVTDSSIPVVSKDLVYPQDEMEDTDDGHSSGEMEEQEAQPCKTKENENELGKLTEYGKYY